MSIYRRFSPQFRHEVVQQIISGQKSRAQVCREYQVAPRVVGRWKSAYLQQGEQAFHPARVQASVEELSVPKRLEALERLCGRLSLENALLKKALSKSHQPSPNAMP